MLLGKLEGPNNRRLDSILLSAIDRKYWYVSSNNTNGIKLGIEERSSLGLPNSREEGLSAGILVENTNGMLEGLLDGLLLGISNSILEGAGDDMSDGVSDGNVNSLLDKILDTMSDSR